MNGSRSVLMGLLGLLSLGVLAAPASAWQAQGQTPKELVFPLPRNQPPEGTIESIAPDGLVRAVFAADDPDASTGLSEGHYLLFPATVARPAAELVRLLRVEVQAIETDNRLSFQATPEAVRHLSQGQKILLWRPAGSSTAQMRSIPSVVPFGGAVADDPNQRESNALAQSMNNLRQIGLAIHNFANVYNHLPPAVVYGPDGRPWHSWRVLLLPYMEQAELYNAYDFSQPWDSEANRPVLEAMPDLYRDPIHGDDAGHFTHYVAFVGERAAFSPIGQSMPNPQTMPWGQTGPGVRQFQNVRDGTANTIMVGPVDPERKIPWTKPDDIAIGPNFPHLGQAGGIATPYRAEDGTPAAPIAFMDGSIRVVTAENNPDVFQAMLTINGGEVISVDQIKTAGPGPGSRSRPVLKIILEDEGARAEIGQAPEVARDEVTVEAVPGPLRAAPEQPTAIDIEEFTPPAPNQP